MKKLIMQMLLAFPVWFMLGSVSFAMCIWFAPPSRQFTPASNMKTLLSYDERNITMTVQPQFSGDATNFALVMPFPSEPVVEEAPEEIFNQLENIANPELDGGCEICATVESADQSFAREEGVTIIEERDVGDFATTTLSATSESALITWLKNEGYEITDEKAAIISQYVDTDGYFVALKVNMDKAEVDDNGFLNGELKPISFVFESDDPMLPLRLMAGDNGFVTLTVYTLNNDITYIPGAELQFSKKVDATHLKDAPALEQYDAWQKWLVRNVISVNTADIENDLGLLSTTETRVVVPGEQPIILNPDQLPIGTGVEVSENGVTIYTDEAATKKPTTSTSSDDPLTTPVIFILVATNVLLLGVIVVQHNSRTNKKPTPKK